MFSITPPSNALMKTCARPAMCPPLRFIGALQGVAHVLADKVVPDRRRAVVTPDIAHRCSVLRRRRWTGHRSGALALPLARDGLRLARVSLERLNLGACLANLGGEQ